MIRPHVEVGRLVVKPVARARAPARLFYAWRSATNGERGHLPASHGGGGLALQWWLDQLDKPQTREALIERHTGWQPSSQA